MNPVIAMLIGVVVMMVLVICTRMHAFPSLIISAILIAVLSGNYLLVGTGNEGGNLLSVAISTVTGGFGGTMTSIGIVIGFGCIMGIFLEKSGAAKRMAITILKLVGVKRADVVLGLTGFVVSIPVFCDSGFVILSSLAKEFLPSDQEIHGRSGWHPGHGPVYHPLHGSPHPRPSGCCQHLPERRHQH